MYDPKVVTTTAAATATAATATLPVTGSAVGSMILFGVGLVIAGALLVRSSRLRKAPH